MPQASTTAQPHCRDERLEGRALGLKPMVRLVASAAAGVPRAIMGIGPVPAVRKALQRAGLTVEQLGLVELNEAFAVQALAVMDELACARDHQRERRSHRAGSSAGLLRRPDPHDARSRDAPPRAECARPFFGWPPLCVGVGQGEATVVEWAGGDVAAGHASPPCYTDRGSSGDRRIMRSSDDHHLPS